MIGITNANKCTTNGFNLEHAPNNCLWLQQKINDHLIPNYKILTIDDLNQNWFKYEPKFLYLYLCFDINTKTWFLSEYLTELEINNFEKQKNCFVKKRLDETQKKLD